MDLVQMPPSLTERILSSTREAVGLEDMDANPPAIIVAKELRDPFHNF